jgi:hypothetical protein
MSSPASVAPPEPSRNPRPTRFLRWHQRVLGFCLVIFALELGLFLLVFPWLSSWNMSWIPVHSPELTSLWMSRYFRGALSGLGLLNLYIAFAELLRQIRALFG